MASAVHFNKEQFEAALAQPGCAARRFLGGVVHALQNAGSGNRPAGGGYEGRVVIGKVDVDEEPELAGRYHVQSIPNVVIFRDGEMVGTLVGARPYEAFAEELDKVLASA